MVKEKQPVSKSRLISGVKGPETLINRFSLSKHRIHFAMKTNVQKTKEDVQIINKVLALILSLSAVQFTSVQ